MGGALVSGDDVVETRAAYDAGAAEYVAWVGTQIAAATEMPLDRAILVAYADAVRGHPQDVVADIGCGPGRAASFLADHGIRTVGLDLSRAMLCAARDAHDDLPLAQANLRALPLRDASLAGVVSWYSIIHTPPASLVSVLAELSRPIAPAGHVLVAFQGGAGEAVRREGLFGKRVSLTSFRHAPDAVCSGLIAAGLVVRDVVVREPELPHETTAQVFVVARRRGT